MEMSWVEHVNALRDRVQHEDTTLTHLQPYFTEDLFAERSSPANGNNENTPEARDEQRMANVSSASSMFQTMVLLEDLQVQAALTRMWEACTTASNPNVKRVTFPAAWPAADLRRALHAIGGLKGLQRVSIVVDPDHWESESDEENETFARNASLRAWHATPLDITGDILPFLERQIKIRANVHVPFSSSLQHLRLDNRLIIRTQDEIDHLAGLLSQFKQIQFLSLFLSCRSAGGDDVLSLDPLFQAVNQLSRRIPQQEEEGSDTTGLQILCLQWSDLFHAHQAVVSAHVLEELLQYQHDGSESVTTIRKMSLCGLYLGSAHLKAVAKALPNNTVLENLTLSGHNMKKHGSVTSSCLQAMLDVLENQNHTLKNISVYSSNEVQLSHRTVKTAVSPRSSHHDNYTSVGSGRSEEDEHAHCCRLQEQMELFCKLNRLGRATLVCPNATSHDWVNIITQCTADDRQKATDSRCSSSVLSCVNCFQNDPYNACKGEKKRDEERIGLNEVFLLLRMYPSFFYVGDRPTFDSTIPPEFERLRCFSLYGT